MKIKRTFSAAVLSLGLVVGLAGFAGASSGTITGTGPNSYNKVKNRSSTHVRVQNNNNLGVSNHNGQSAWSGDAESHGNTTAGGASAGAAMNSNGFNAAATVNNASSSNALMSAANAGTSSSNSGSISNTGPRSTNIVKFKSSSRVNVENNNNLSVTNTNEQCASSGDAEVSHNTTGGSATTGAASNTNTSSVTFNVSN